MNIAREGKGKGGCWQRGKGREGRKSEDGGSAVEKSAIFANTVKFSSTALRNTKFFLSPI